MTASAASAMLASGATISAHAAAGDGASVQAGGIG